jgi:hypothetical protein
MQVLRRRFREHVGLMSKKVYALLGAGGVLGIYALAQAIDHGLASRPHHNSSVWPWVAAALAFLFVAEILTAEEALKQRRESKDALLKFTSAGASTTTGPPMVHHSGSGNIVIQAIGPRGPTGAVGATGATGPPGASVDYSLRPTDDA